LLVEIHVVVHLGVLVARPLLLLAARLLVIPHLLGALALLLLVVPILLLPVVPIRRVLLTADSVGRISSWPFQRPSQRVALALVQLS